MEPKSKRENQQSRDAGPVLGMLFPGSTVVSGRVTQLFSWEWRRKSSESVRTKSWGMTIQTHALQGSQQANLQQL